MAESENKKIIVIGIPGVGKSTLMRKVVEILQRHDKRVKLVGFGTLMFDIAKDHGIDDRDKLRRLPIPEQQRLQKLAAQQIAAEDGIVIVDTHAFISSPEGYYPGLPEYVLNIIKPSNFISVSAKPEEIYSRRIHDTTRSRDLITVATIKKELDVQSSMISTCSVITGSPTLHVLNGEGMIDETAEEITNSLGL